MKTLIATLLLVVCAGSGPAQNPPRPPRDPDGPRPAARRGGDGPWNHRILLATSSDGLRWETGASALAEPASVPELFAGPDGRAIVIFVDANRPGLGALVEQADGSWQRERTDLRGVDPNVVALKDGGYRAYVKDGLDGAIAAYSSDDGLDWRREREVFRDERYPRATDPDVFQTADGWVMLLSLGPRLLRCASADGWSFTAGETLDLGGSVSDTVAVEGGWRTYFHRNGDPQRGEKMSIRSAFTADGRSWKTEDGVRVEAPASGPARLGVADPAPLRRKDGTWLMAVKSFIEEPRREFRAENGPGEFRPREPGDFNPGEPRGGQRPFPGGAQPAPPDGPWQRDLRSVVVERDQVAGPPEFFLQAAGVPCVVKDGKGRLIAVFQWFPGNEPDSFDQVAVQISEDHGRAWTKPRTVKIKDLPAGYTRPFDPTLAVLEDGRLRLYFTSNPSGSRQIERRTGIYSAISSDGLNYTFEPGTRFTVKEGQAVIDCAVVRLGQRWHLFAPLHPNRAYHATSGDGLEFQREDDIVGEEGANWTGNALAHGDGIRFYGHAPREGLWWAFSKDGQTWTRPNYLGVRGGDAGVVELGEDKQLLIYVGDPARRRPPPNRPESR